jgi:hypothetical protein
VALFLCGCSQTTVHLYSRYLSPPQLETINKELVAANFVVKPNQLQFPQSVTQSSLTYSPLIKDRNAVNKIVNTMSHIGWNIQRISMLFTDNHWYKENSIALMLVPPDVDPKAESNRQNWINQYTSKNCEKELNINLKKNGQYQVLTAQNQPLKHHIAAGKWTISQFPYLELRPTGADWGLYFELEKRLEVDQIGQIDIKELNQMNKHSALGDCSFIYGLRI